MVDNNGVGYITELTASDVLFGRGSGPNDHEGNIRFRHLVAERKSEYLATNHRQTKAKIAREIVNKVLEDRGRFLKKVEHFEARRLGIPKGVDAWIIVDDDTVMEKAKQALRQNTNKQRANSPNRGGVHSPVRGNSPVRQQVSPLRGGQHSPIPQNSPMAAAHHHQMMMQQQQRRLPQQMPTFDDLEPLPLGSNGNINAANLAAAARAQQFAQMTPAQQQLAIQQQVQLQVQAQAQAQQQQQRRQQQQQQMANLAALEPTAIGAPGWSGNSDQNLPTLAAAAQLLSSGTGSDWGGSNQQGGWGGVGQPQPQHQQQSMGPPQVPSSLEPNQIQYSNSNANNWNNASEHTLPAANNNQQQQQENNSAKIEDDDKKRRQSLHMEDLMDSFSQLKAVGDFSAEAKLQESTDTMGTIEPIGAFNESTSMSVTSFSSSTFSIFGKNPMGESTDDMRIPSRGVSRSSSQNDGPSRSGSDSIDASMQSFQSMGSLGDIGGEVWGSQGMSLLDRLVQEERERANQEGGGNAGGGGGSGGGGGGGGGGLAENPRPVGLMEEEPDRMNSLGASSMSVMKAAYNDSPKEKQGQT